MLELVLVATAKLLMNMSAWRTLSVSQLLLSSLVASARGIATPWLWRLELPSLSMTACEAAAAEEERWWR